ncbi:MAG: hypothetical protein C0519_11835 [Hyphomicrobium sp.]|nr:hypothetical protein [Hyphomicrobium sp.]PPD07251.1 MAG: hypothetical protein CTY28_10795 [Hyphomicrobium sp.]
MLCSSNALKSLAATATAALLATIFLSAAAHAGCGGRHGGGYSARTTYSTPSPAYASKLRARKAAEARAVAAAKRQKTIEIAKARAATKARTVAAAKKADAKAEQVAAVSETATPETKAPATKTVEVAATPSTCRKFVPATGTTVEVPCSIE